MKRNWAAFLALRDLDREVYYNNGQWTTEPALAQRFLDEGDVREIAVQLDLKNADMVFLDGEPPEVVGSLPIRISN